MVQDVQLEKNTGRNYFVGPKMAPPNTVLSFN